MIEYIDFYNPEPYPWEYATHEDFCKALVAWSEREDAYWDKVNKLREVLRVELLKEAEEAGDVETAECIRSRIAEAEARKAGDTDKADRIEAEMIARDEKTEAMRHEAFLKAQAAKSRPS